MHLKKCGLSKMWFVNNPILGTYVKIKQDFIVEPYLFWVKKPKYIVAIPNYDTAPTPGQ